MAYGNFREIKGHDLNEITAALQYERFRSNKIVFDHGKKLNFMLNFLGSIGDKFYIIL